MRARCTWRLRSRSLALGERTLIMGIVNVTPDSFSDGGQFSETDAAVAHALELLREGADILDLGGESTRPGAVVAGAAIGDGATVSQDEELRRVMPVIEGVLRERADAVISVDTYRAATAQRAVEAGAEIVNDVSGGAWDAAMPAAIAELRCGAVLMHTRGRPDEWRSMPPLENAIATIAKQLGEIVQRALAAGVERERLVLDPGFGFGKRGAENFQMLSRFGEFAALGFPLLAGTSRKGFIGKTLERGICKPPAGTLFGTLATVTASILGGAHVVRVHDVAAAREAALIADEILKASP